MAESNHSGNAHQRLINNKSFLIRFNEEVINVSKSYTAKLEEIYHDIFSSCEAGTITLVDALEEISSDKVKCQHVILKLRSLIAFSSEHTNTFRKILEKTAIDNPSMTRSRITLLMSQKFYTDTSTLKSHVSMLSKDLQLKALNQNASDLLMKTIASKNNHQSTGTGRKDIIIRSKSYGSFSDLKTLTSCLGHEILLMRTVVKSIDDDVKDRLVAHRGFHCTMDNQKYRPLENTLAAYEQAWSLGMKHAECDVVLTKDNRLMLCHDDTFKRLALLPSRRLFLNTHPNHLEAKEVLTKCVTRSGAGVPFLTHVLDIAAAIGSHKKLVIEIKPGLSGTADRLMQILKTNISFLENISVIMSFQLSIISHFADLFRTTFPGVTETKVLYLLAKPEEAGKYPQPYNHFPIDTPSQLEDCIGKLDGFYVGYSNKLLSTHKDIFRSICKKYVVGVYDMNPDCISTARELIDIGVDFVNTDMPRALGHGQKDP